MNQVGRPRKNFDYPSYKGGYTSVDVGGYILEYSPDHPYHNSRDMVRQHRLVMEDHIGRYLRPDELVHHKDFDRQNNSLDNLEIMSRSEHQKLHNDLRIGTFYVTEDQVREALQGRTTKEASEFLGMHERSLYYRFGHLLNKRRSPHSVDDPEVIQMVRDAAVRREGVRKFAKDTGISAEVVKKVCEKYGITWVPQSREGYKWKHKRTSRKV